MDTAAHTGYAHDKAAVLLLEDGTFLRGTAVGGLGTAAGELCFNTGMMGYQEMYSDPSYFGQIVVNTQCHMGNYGVRDDGAETEADAPKISGCVWMYGSSFFARHAATRSLHNYLTHHGIPAMAGVDTRFLVRHLRRKGSMNAVLSSLTTDKESLKKVLHKVPSMKGLQLASRVSTPRRYVVKGRAHNGGTTKRVAVVDVGVKQSILSALKQRGITCVVYPSRTPFARMEQAKPDGYLISNGPGDPATMHDVIANIKQMIAQERPLFGICLGHQLLALACDISTYKLRYGHRGVNHSVINVETGRCEVTSQNHGFSVNKEEVLRAKTLKITHLHLNDGTVAGISIRNKKIFSVQFHPEASPGPDDSSYLFDKFAAML